MYAPSSLPLHRTLARHQWPSQLLHSFALLATRAHFASHAAAQNFLAINTHTDQEVRQLRGVCFMAVFLWNEARYLE